MYLKTVKSQTCTSEVIYNILQPYSSKSVNVN